MKPLLTILLAALLCGCGKEQESAKYPEWGQELTAEEAEKIANAMTDVVSPWFRDCPSEGWHKLLKDVVQTNGMLSCPDCRYVVARDGLGKAHEVWTSNDVSYFGTGPNISLYMAYKVHFFGNAEGRITKFEVEPVENKVAREMFSDPHSRVEEGVGRVIPIPDFWTDSNGVAHAGVKPEGAEEGQ